MAWPKARRRSTRLTIQKCRDHRTAGCSVVSETLLRGDKLNYPLCLLTVVVILPDLVARSCAVPVKQELPDTSFTYEHVYSSRKAEERQRTTIYNTTDAKSAHIHAIKSNINHRTMQTCTYINFCVIFWPLAENSNTD